MYSIKVPRVDVDADKREVQIVESDITKTKIIRIYIDGLCVVSVENCGSLLFDTKEKRK